MKRMFDFFCALAGFLMLSPLFLLIGIAIKINSPGPVLYKGRRIGRHGTPFYMFKFRTMVVNAEKIGGSSTAENDPRITKIGSFLRKSKLDEIPQLLNIIRGEMSLVGPRPEVEEYTSMYTDEEKLILSVRPGITDYSSIQFRNLNTILAGSEDPDKHYRDVIRPVKNQLRLQYVRKQSFMEDLKIIFKTLYAVIAK